MQLSRYVKIFPFEERHGYVLLYSTKKTSSLLIRESLLRSIEEGTLSPSSAESLSRLGMLVSDDAQEREQVLGMFDAYNKGCKRFNAMAVMNLDCNLACAYCYEGGMKGRHYMSPGTADALIDYIEKHPLSEGKDVRIDFYGGEPLLSFEQVRYISGRLKASAQEKGLGYSFSLVTNGTLLTGERATELVRLGLTGAKVTIDGPREVHDRLRPFRSGSGTFDAIIGNLSEVYDIIDIQVGGNFTRNNYREFPRLLDYLLDAGFKPGRLALVKFDPVLAAESGFGLPDFREGCGCINEPWLFEASVFLREEILKRGFRTARIMPAFCMVELKDDIVVNYDGAIYKCPGFIGRKDLDVGHLRSGMQDYAQSHRLDIWKNQECLGCVYLPLCFGGCRYMKLLRDGGIDGVDCRKEYLDATLESFVRQEIKYKLKHDRN